MILLSSQSETRFFLTITFIVYMLKTIGLAPFSPEIKTSTKNSRSKSTAGVFRFSKIGLAYNALLLVLFQVMNAVALPTFVSVPYPHSTSVTHAIDVVQGVICALATHVILISSTLQQKTAVLVMNRILEVDRLLSGIEKEPRNEKVIFMSVALHGTFNALVWITARAAGALLVSDPILWTFYTVSHLVVYSFIVEYFLVVGLLAKQLERVNKNLSKLREFPNLLSRISFLNDCLVGLNFSTRIQLDPLKLLLEIRTELYEVSKDIAGFFSLPMVLTIGYFYLLLVYNVYYLINTLLTQNPEFPLMEVCNGMAWIMMVAYSITSLSLNVRKATKEAKLTGWIIHKLLATATRPEIKTELRRFSLQLLHEHIRFTAYGFFTLDCTMLHSILEATAMYNVILIQFSKFGK